MILKSYAGPILLNSQAMLEAKRSFLDKFLIYPKVVSLTKKYLTTFDAVCSSNQRLNNKDSIHTGSNLEGFLIILEFD